LHQKTYANEKEAALNQDEYFNEMKSSHNSMYLNDPYSTSHMINSNMMQGVYGIGSPTNLAPTPLANGNGSMPMNSKRQQFILKYLNYTELVRFQPTYDSIYISEKILEIIS